MLNETRSKSSRNKTEFETTPVKTRQKRNNNEGIYAALQLNKERIEHELDKWNDTCLNNTKPLEDLKEWNEKNREEDYNFYHE